MSAAKVRHALMLLFVAFAFSFQANSQTVTITAPNGGEILYACQTYNITWTQSGAVSNLWNIDYTLDGGTIWASVTSNLLSTNGTFAWTVPNVQSSTVRIRIRDAQNALTTDQSNADFSINIPVVVVSPNGGQVWYGNTTQTILWNFNGTSNQFNISYSTNGGTSWNTIVNSYSSLSGSYSWNIPAIAASANCLIRVMDAVTNCMVDISNAPFTILPPTPDMTYPVGGETFAADCNVNITWNTATIYTSTVRLEYSLNNGSTWNLISTSESNDGSANWTAPATAQSQVLIRLFNNGDLTLYDTTPAVFAIAPPVTITYPNGGESFTTCGTMNIQWSKSSCISQYAQWTLSYSTDNGSTYTTITSVYNTLNQSTQSYNWSIPSTVSGTNCKIKIAYSSYVDESNASFAINTSNDITVTSPNGGESWQGLTNHLISWTNTANTSGIFTLQYSTNNGASFNTISTNTVGNNYNWTVPNAITSTALIKVYDSQNTCKFDNSNAVFSITPVTPVLLTPNGGETYQADCGATITWDQTTIYASTVRLEYSTNNGLTWTLISNTEPNDGSASWTVPDYAFTQGLVRIYNTGDLTLSDVSTATFTVNPYVTVTSPNGGESFTGCSTLPITWSKSSCISQYAQWTLSYSLDNGATYTTITSVYNTLNQSSQTYNWSLPAGLNSAQCLIKVAYSSYNDASNAVFTILPNNDVTVTSPNGGESWQAQTVQPITWTGAPTNSGFYTLEYSLNSGSSYTTIQSNVTGNSYNWTLPNSSSATAKIRVSDTQNTCKTDASNNVFAITPVSPILLTPNGGEVLQADCSTTITWNTASIYASTVRLEYSTNNGTTWNLISNTEPNDGSASWTVPDFAFTQGLVRIFNTGDLSLSDVSAATFSANPYVTVTSPNGGESYTGCSTLPITWSKSSCISQYAQWTLSYSLDNGVTYTTITSVYNTLNQSSQTYNWSLPAGINSSQCLIKVAYGSYNDVSNSSFTILPNTDVTVTSPNGGESWQGLSVHQITWTGAITNSGFYTLEYSLNGGSSYTTIASNVVGNTYLWTLPNAVSTTAKIRVSDTQNTCKTDASNAVFNITPVTPILLTPNGGETLQADCSTTITWNTSTIYTSTVRLEYSTNNGLTWNLISNTEPNDGSASWSVPDYAFTEGLVRIYNSGDLTLSDVSATTFTVIPPVTITSPNGGESYTGCSNLPITWSKSSCISQYAQWTLSYSLDNGATYTTITSVYNTLNQTSQTYNWSLPAGLNSTQCKIKVAYSSYVDESNSTFTILPNNDITVLTPNGGEIWGGQTTQLISWSGSPGNSGFYTLEYSLNNGSSYSTIQSNVTGTTYNWTVPNASSTTAKIKVSDTQNTCKTDASNAAFTITPVNPILLTPNGGEVLAADCSTTITWNTSSIYTSTVRIEYSTNNGATWNLISNTEPNDGSAGWTVPDYAFTQGLVRIFNSGDLTLSDVSASNFTVNPYVTVTTPNGGQTFTGCSLLPITWAKSSCISQYAQWTLSYSLDNGATFTTITSVYNTLNQSSQTYNWSLPAGISSTQCLIKVAYGSYNDVSNSAFTIIPSNDITVTSPNGGETFSAGTSQLITWTNLPTASGFYNVRYYTPSTGNTTIATNIIGNSYSWTVPNISSNQVTVEVEDAQNTCKTDESNANFTIIPSSPVLLTPNGGESFYAGTTTSITWSTASIYTSDVRLDYSIDEGVTWINITTSTTNDGNYTWTVPDTQSSVALVRISIPSNQAYFDISNAVFTIKPMVRIITPNGDDGVTEWGGCTVTTISFERSPAYNSYTIQYSVNGGSTWVNIATNWTTSANPASYTWTMPNLNNVATLVKVTTTSGGYSDQSDATFVINKPVTLIQPNFGGILQVGTSYEVQWSSDGISNYYDLFYSTNGGSTYTNIVTGYITSTNTYAWNVPALPSSNCKMVIRDNVNTCKSDTSDVAFTISNTAAPIQILTPNGITDNLVGCSTYLIDWVETSAIGTYTIEYSLNGGASWTTIISNYTTANSQYSWVVPNITSSSVLLRVRSATNSNIFDLTDAYFSIDPGVLEVTQSAETICEGQTVQLNVTGGGAYSWTPTTGLNFNNIANPIASPTSTTAYTVQSNIAGCVLSETVEITVTPATAVAGVSVTATNNGNSICTGTLVTFSASPQSGGGNPSYQWYVNGSPVGNGSSTYSSSSLQNNDVVSVQMTSDLSCVSNNPANSNSITMSVAGAVLPTAVVTPSVSNSTCNGSSQTFTATITNGGSTPSFVWKVNGNTVGGNSASYTAPALYSGDIVTVQLTSSSSCATVSQVTSSPYTVQLSSGPAAPSGIVGSTTFCNSDVLTFNANTVSGATQYNWTLPVGWTGSSTSASIQATAGSSAGNITVTAQNACGTSSPATITLTQGAAPSAPTSILGSASFCAGSSLSYTINPVAGATSYIWTLPSGWSGTSSATTIYATGGNTGGNITVSAINGCGVSTPSTLTVSSIPTLEAPVIIGNSEVCANTPNTYSVTPIAGATSYEWTLPNGFVGSSSSSNIQVNVGDASGTIIVEAVNACGTGDAGLITINVNDATPAVGPISGNSTYCSGDALTFTIDPIDGISSYEWQIPNGWSGASTGTSISVIAGSIQGNISVSALGECGNGESQSISLTPNSAIAAPSNISGPTALCVGSASTFEVEPVNGASSYYWVLPAGWLGSSTSTSIDATSGISGGTIEVYAVGDCGSSVATTINVDILTAPTTPVATAQILNFCPGGTALLSVENEANTTYNWILPADWSGNSTSYQIALVAGDTEGTAYVSAQNICGTSAPTSIELQLGSAPSIPSSIIGSIELCGAGPYTYTTPAVAGADTYSWSLPTGWFGSSSSNEIDVTANGNGGQIAVIAENACGSSAPTYIQVDVIEINNSISVDGNSIVAEANGLNYQWIDCANGNSPIQNQTEQSFGFTQSGTYAVQITEGGCEATSDCVNVVYVGIEESATVDFTVYPNPTLGETTITVRGNQVISVYDMTGGLIERFRASGTTTKDFSHLASGVYLLQTENGENVRLVVGS